MRLNNWNGDSEGNDVGNGVRSGDGQGMDDIGGLFIAVDGGGTKTACLLGDAEGRILASAEGESTNLKSRPPEAVKRVIAGLFRAVLAEAGARDTDVRQAYLGMAGGDRPEDKRRLASYAAEALPHPAAGAAVGNDAVTALAAGAWGEAGIALIAGTGSIAYGFQPDSGRQVRIGGWGYLLGDEGSGYAIGREALAAVLRAHDGRAGETLLTLPVLERFGLADPTGLVTRIYESGYARKDIADCAPLVLDAARRGDAAALAIADNAAAELLLLAETAYSRLGAEGPLPLVLSGGLFADEGFTSRFTSRVSTVRFELRRPELPPVIGAYVLALREAGISIGTITRNNILESWNRRRVLDSERQPE